MKFFIILTLIPILISCASTYNIEEPQIITEQIDQGFHKLMFRTSYGTHKVDEISVSPQSYPGPRMGNM